MRSTIRGIVVALAGALASEGAWAQTNVAVDGTAQQTSTCFSLPATNGNDTNYDNVTHTCAGNDGLGAAVWELDLGVAREIDQIVVHNRRACCQSRMRDIVISVHDAPYLVDGAVVGDPIGEDGVWVEALWQSALLNPENELGGGSIDGGPATLTADILATEGAAVSGRYVRVTRLPDPDNSGIDGRDNLDEATDLSIAEVEVFVDPSTLPPSILTQPAGAQAERGSCHRFTVELFNAEGAEVVTYQWTKDGAPIDGATGSELFLSELVVGDSGSYAVTVDIDGLVLESDAAELLVTLPNLAIGGTATQVNVDFGGEPQRAIDGNTSGVYNNGSMTHTANTEGGWFEVALREAGEIDSIVLWNRTDCCQERLSNFRLSVLDAERNEVFGEDYFPNPPAAEGDPLFPETPDFTVDIGGVLGAIVRVERLGPDPSGNNFLSLAEVQVFGEGEPAPAPKSLTRACGVRVSQSTTSGAFVPELAINGSLGDFTHTVGTDDAAWWQVELADVSEIGIVTIHNRSSCCGSRLRDITVEILDEAGGVVYSSPLLNPENELGAYPNGPASLTVDLQFGETGVVTGKYVVIRRTPDPDLSGSGGEGNADESNVLSLGEVEVCPPVDCSTSGDAHCDEVVVEGPEDSGPGVYTVTVMATDDTGDPLEYSLEAESAEGALISFAPQASNVFTLNLPLGTWTVTTVVDDSVCPDDAEDNVCSTVIDVICEANNLATNGVASQSTTGFSGEAARAIDCNTDGVYGNASTTHTATGDTAPSWMVDLLDTYSIERIVIWGRTDDCCTSRLTNFRVSVLDAEGAEVWGEDYFTDGTFPVTTTEGFAVDLSEEAVVGNMVRIARLGLPEDFPDAFFLSLAEVEVFGSEVDPGVGPFVRGDSNRDGRLDLSDAPFTLSFLFLGGEAPACSVAADTNGDGQVDLSDAVAGLNFLFLGGPMPPAPYPECGTSASEADVALGCDLPLEGCL